MYNIFSARRIMPSDIPQLCTLASTSKEFSFFNDDTAKSIMESGEMWCCLKNREISAFGGFVSANASNRLCEAAMKTGIISSNATLVLPVCAGIDFLASHRFFEWYHSRAGGKNQVIASLLPVKSTQQSLCFYFSLGLCLVAMRPMYNLRPFYIFIQRIMQNEDKEAIIVNVSDTLLLSRFLASGYCGVEAVKIDNELKIKLVKLF